MEYSSDKLVSIVLPVYNGEKYLEDSINSVLKQTYSNIEFIIVNDCSTDNSENIILRYKEKDSRIIYIKNSTNQKLPKSLNIGFNQAHGDYLTWTSDDNSYHLDAIENMVSFMESNSNIALVYCDYNIIDEESNFIEKRVVKSPEKIYYIDVVGACFLYRKEVLETVGKYDENAFLVEDYEYWLRINLHYEIAAYHECLYEYRKHSGSLTATRQNQILNALDKLKLEYLRRYEEKGIENKVLFSYFESIIKTKSGFRNQAGERIKFAIHHKGYLQFILTKIINKIFAQQ